MNGLHTLLFNVLNIMFKTFVICNHVCVSLLLADTQTSLCQEHQFWPEADSRMPVAAGALICFSHCLWFEYVVLFQKEKVKLTCTDRMPAYLTVFVMMAFMVSLFCLICFSQQWNLLPLTVVKITLIHLKTIKRLFNKMFTQERVWFDLEGRKMAMAKEKRSFESALARDSSIG